MSRDTRCNSIDKISSGGVTTAVAHRYSIALTLMLIEKNINVTFNLE
jgi:hypothetical protein